MGWGKPPFSNMKRSKRLSAFMLAKIVKTMLHPKRGSSTLATTSPTRAARAVPTKSSE